MFSADVVSWSLTHNIEFSYRQNQIAQVRLFKAKNKTLAYHYVLYTGRMVTVKTTYKGTEECKPLVSF